MRMYVETKYVTFEEKVKLENGADLGPITVAYETYGELNKAKDNAMLVLHALSGDAHAAGYHTPEDKHPGWWDKMIGPGKAFDTDKYFILCSNFLGGCKGTTGPSSINPETNEPYGVDFPSITISDMVNVQKKLVEHFGIKRLLNVAGGSMGGMQAFEWTIMYPEMVESAMIIASATRTSAQNIAFNEVGRNAILSDPVNGLSIARMIGHITYLSEESMHKKFGKDPHSLVKSYLEYQGQSFVDRFDANSYLYITKAMDHFDLNHKYGSLAEAFKDTQSRFLFVTFSTDWLFPPDELKDAARAIMSLGKEVTYCNIDAPFGHDSFLIEEEHQTRIIRNFLKGLR